MSKEIAGGASVQVGDVVLFHMQARDPAINGSRTHPAIVTRVWGTANVNLLVMIDAGEGPIWVENVLRKGWVPQGGAHWEPRPAP